MRIIAVLPILVTSMCTIVYGATVSQLVETYSALLSSNFENLAVLTDWTVDIFDPKVYKWDSELMADKIASSIKELLTTYDAVQYKIESNLPKNELKAIMLKYPKSFSLQEQELELQIDELIGSIEFLQMTLLQRPTKIYELFLANRDRFKSILERRIWGSLYTKESLKPTGFLQTVLLLFDHVEEDFINSFSSVLSEEVKLTALDVEERWRAFFDDLEADIPKNEQAKDTLSWITLNLLLKNGHSRLVTSKLMRYATQRLKSAVLKSTYKHLRNLYSPPYISIDDFRPRKDYDATKSSCVVSNDVNGVNFFVTLPTEVLQLILSFCIKNDWLHTIIACSRVCKRIHQFTTVSDIKNLNRIVGHHEDAAIRLINDANRTEPDSENYRLGYPWKLSNRADIFSLFVNAMTAHQTTWTIDNLFNDITRHFPDTSNLNNPKEKTYGRWHTIVGQILQHHKFIDSHEYLLFAKRAISISVSKVTLYFNDHLDWLSTVNCLETMLNIENVKIKLQLNIRTIAIILSAFNLPNPRYMLYGMMDCAPSEFEIYDLFSHLFLLHHFDKGDGFKNALILLSDSLERNIDADLNPDRETKKRILVKYMEKSFTTFPNTGLFEFLLAEILNGEFPFGPEHRNLVIRVIFFFFTRRLPADKFGQLLAIIKPDNDLLRSIYNILFHYAST